MAWRGEARLGKAGRGKARQGNNNFKSGRGIMKELKIKLVGQSPLITHNIRLANPLGEYAQAMKSLTGKRNKTDADLKEIAKLEWEGGLYLEDGVVVMPAKCLNSCFFEGAKKKKNGPKWRTGAILPSEHYPMEYNGAKINISVNGDIPNPDLDKYYSNFNDQRMVRVGTGQILRTRPLFLGWSVPDVGIMYDENILDKRTLLQICEDAGYLVGLCEMRPGSKGGGTYGRFIVENI